MRLGSLPFLLSLAALSAAPSRAAAHTLLLAPAPRSNADGLKLGPCGNVPRTATPSRFNAGATLTVSWRETVEHPGNYRIAFAPADDAGFNDNVLADLIADTGGAAPHEYSTTITLPSTPCTGCTLQLSQYMSDSMTRYFSCADIELLAADADASPPGTPDGAPLGNGDAGALPTADASHSIENPYGAAPGLCAIATPGAQPRAGTLAGLALLFVGAGLIGHRRGQRRQR